MSEYAHLYETMAAEAPTAKKRPILFMGQLEIQMNELLKEVSPHYEVTVSPSHSWSMSGWDDFTVRVGTDHGNQICDFTFDFPDPKFEVRWNKCAELVKRMILAAIKAI